MLHQRVKDEIADDSNKTIINFILDIDDTLAKGYSDSKDKLLDEQPHISWFIKNGLFIETSHPHIIYPGAVEFLKYLSSIPNSKISFFSAGEAERNKIFVNELCKLANVTNIYKILSRKDLSPSTQYSGKGSALFSGYKKDLRKICGEDLETTILIDDDTNYAAVGQEKNLLCTPCNSYSLEKGIKNLKEFFEANHIFYIAGLINKVLIEGRVNLTNRLSSLQRYTSERIVSDTDIKFLIDGYNILKQYNPKLELYYEKEKIEHNINQYHSESKLFDCKSSEAKASKDSDEMLHYNRKLKPAFQKESEGEAKVVFVFNPAARLDKYVLIDEAGEEYVRALVPPTEFEQQSLEPLLSSVGKRVILEGYLTVNQFISHEANGRFRYFLPLLPEHDRGESLENAKNCLQAFRDKFIHIDEFLELNSDDRRDLEYLFTEDGLQALKNNKITVSDFLRIPREYLLKYPRECLADASGKNYALKAIADSLITVAQVRMIAVMNCEEEGSKNIFRHEMFIPILRSKLMTADDFIHRISYSRGYAFFESALIKWTKKQLNIPVRFWATKKTFDDLNLLAEEAIFSKRI